MTTTLKARILPKGNNGKDGCCIRCGKKLKMNEAVFLELDQRVDEYHDFGGIPDADNQGGFEFGPDCAEILRKRARDALDLRNPFSEASRNAASAYRNPKPRKACQ